MIFSGFVYATNERVHNQHTPLYNHNHPFDFFDLYQLTHAGVVVV